MKSNNCFSPCDAQKCQQWSKCPSQLICRVWLRQPRQQHSPCLDLFFFIAQCYLKVSGVAGGAVFALPRSTCLPAARFPPISLPPARLGGGGESPQGVRSPSIGMQVSPREVRVEGICQVWDSGRDTEGHLSHHLCFPVPLLLGQNWTLN